MIVTDLQSASIAAFPEVRCLRYTSGADGYQDKALIWPNPDATDWVVVIHGHGSSQDQLYTRADIRDQWLPAFHDAHRLGILTPNLRGNAWMSPAAVTDLHELLAWTRANFGGKRFFFASGSMGGTSNLIHAICHPQDVAGIVALGMAGDVASFYQWCRAQADNAPAAEAKGVNIPLVQELAQAIEDSYGAKPSQAQELYRSHSALRHAERLTMPLYLAHGTDDAIIPVQQTRALVGALADHSQLAYVEIPGGGHDAPLSLMPQGLAWVIQQADRIASRR